jgi:hypothetical protein
MSIQLDLIENFIALYEKKLNNGNALPNNTYDERARKNAANLGMLKGALFCMAYDVPGVAEYLKKYCEEAV